MQRDGAPTVSGWTVTVEKMVIQIVFSREKGGGRREKSTTVDLLSPTSIAALLDALNSQRAALAVESGLRLATGDAAERWHKSLASWRRRPRAVMSPGPDDPPA
jgi:hypothetical protein